MTDHEAIQLARTCIDAWAHTLKTGKAPSAGRKGSPYRQSVIARLADAYRVLSALQAKL